MRGKENKVNIGGYNLIFALLLAFVFVVFACSLYGELQKRDELEGRISALATEASDAAKYNMELKQRLTWTDDDTYVEKIARERLNMVRPDEIIYIDKNN